MAERWKKAYLMSKSLQQIIEQCRGDVGGTSGDFTLSDDGLLYIYVDEDEGATPRLVPPEGSIRKELIEDGVRG